MLKTQKILIKSDLAKHLLPFRSRCSWKTMRSLRALYGKTKAECKKGVDRHNLSVNNNNNDNNKNSNSQNNNNNKT